jgi:uncharacterized protein (TIGR02246 family)
MRRPRPTITASLSVALLAALATLAAGPAAAQQPAADTTPAAVVQRFVDAANARDAAAMAALVAPDAVFAQFPGERVFAEGRDGIRRFYEGMLPGLPPAFRITIEPRVVEGNLVIDQEHFAGMPPEQSRATWIYQVQGGLIRRAWAMNGRPPAP